MAKQNYLSRLHGNPNTRCRSRCANLNLESKRWAVFTAYLFVTCLALIMLVAPATAAQSLANSAADQLQTVSTASPIKRIATNLKGFGIPFQFDVNDDSLIEVQLYLSKDKGKTWKFYGRKSTDQTEFPFEAQTDGEYWFALKTLNRNRQLVPAGAVQPELVVVVDTVKPVLSFQIDADPSGRVLCRWHATDTHLDTSTLKIAYQDIGDHPQKWKTVPANLNGIARNGAYADQLAWWPETTSRNLYVRLMIADSAGNQVMQERQVTVGNNPWRHRSSSTARTGDADSARPLASQTRSSDQPTRPQPTLDDWESVPNQTAQISRENSSRKRSDLPNPTEVTELHCQDGVCYLRKSGEAGLGSSRLGASPGSEPEKTGANAQAAGQQAGSRFGKPSLGSRTAAADQQYPRSRNVPLIGDEPEYADPPVPAGYTPEQPAANPSPSDYGKIEKVAQNNFRYQPANRAGVTWNSEPERWTAQRQSSVATTTSPDSSILPNPYPESSPRNPELPDPNPSSLKTVGDQVVSESTTMGPANQYRGLRPPPFQTNNRPPEIISGRPPQSESFVAKDEPRKPAAGFDPAGYRWSTDASRLEADTESATTLKPITQPAPTQTPTQRAQLRSVREAPPASGNFYRDGQDTLSATEMIGSKRFRLNYGIDAIDPSGVAKVDLWMTRNEGRTWTAWGTDPDNQSPFPVQVQEEGRYGFRIVVHSRDGLTGRGPSSGDRPDIWVHVDTQSPLAQIVSVPYGRGDEAGRLVINYRVSDDHLNSRPITISYSRTPMGNWTKIAENQPNDGKFVWKPVAGVPDRIFLRLEAVDRAGNKGLHLLSQAIDVSGLVPRGTIHGVVPVARN